MGRVHGDDGVRVVLAMGVTTCCSPRAASLNHGGQMSPPRGPCTWSASRSCECPEAASARSNLTPPTLNSYSLLCLAPHVEAFPPVLPLTHSLSTIFHVLLSLPPS